MIWRTAIIAQLSSASAVEAPRWGSTMTFSMVMVSGVAKSVMYLATRPSLVALAIAERSTSVSREKLRNTEPCFIDSQNSALIMPIVGGMAGTWMVM